MAFFSNLLQGIGNGIFSNGYALPNTLLPDKVFSRRTQFLQVLDQWWSTPAMNYLWTIVFTVPSLLSDANMKYWGEELGYGEWGVDTSIDKLHNKFEHSANITGCIFAQQVDIPEEASLVEYVGVMNRGYAYAPVLAKRYAPNPIRIKLLETNTSFTDAILRPWTILAQHYGMVARQNGSIKANVQIYELAKSGDYTSDVVSRKCWHFTDAFPSRIFETTRTYSPENPVIIRDVDFHYARYQLQTKFPNDLEIKQQF